MRTVLSALNRTTRDTEPGFPASSNLPAFTRTLRTPSSEPRSSSAHRRQASQEPERPPGWPYSFVAAPESDRTSTVPDWAGCGQPSPAARLHWHTPRHTRPTPTRRPPRASQRGLLTSHKAETQPRAGGWL
ncbi:hypothetical protein GCM10010289_80570 [Streptomyces violascens]|nr:hypothetical protein GCM10010289_80570 [Streptomyces violascens]